MFLSKEYHISRSEILRMPYYEYEWYMQEASDDQKRQEEQRKKDEKNMPKIPDYNSMMRRNSTPSLPKISLPKF